MRPARLWFVLLLATAAPSVLSGSVCVTDSLFNYIALGSAGCTIGPLAPGQFATVKGFAYSLIASTVTIAATDITVTPSQPVDRFALTFSSPKFNVSGSDFARYLLSYTWDPTIRSLEDILDDPVVAPGTATITVKGCKNAPFPCLPGDIVTSTVFDNGTSNHLFDAVVFSPTLSSGILGIQDTIDLEANGGSVSVNSFTNQVVEFTPEPGTFASGLLVVALALRGWRRVR